MYNKNSSRSRMLNAIQNKKDNNIPCCFMIFTALEEKCKDRFEFIERQLELGVDVHVELPELLINFHPDVKVKQWEEKSENVCRLHKVYQTPSGNLSVIVEKTADWPYGNFIPVFSDYLVTRSKKYLIEKKQDLRSLPYLLSSPTNEDITAFREQSKRLKKYAAEKGLLISAGKFGSERGACTGGRTKGAVGGDTLLWLCGVEKAIFLAIDEPDILVELLDIILKWNMKRLEVYLNEGIDLLIRRAWYESTDFWSPSLYHKFFFPLLKKEIALVHEAGAKFGYIMTSGFMPLLDDLLELGIDVLIGVDPLQGKGINLKHLKDKVSGKICLWGGINGALTIERGTEKEVEEAVEKSISDIGPDGFILSPVDNITENTEKTWNNLDKMIKVWQKMLDELR